MLHRTFILACLLLTCAALPCAVVAEAVEGEPKVYRMGSAVNKSVPFVLPLEPETYQQLLDKVPDTALAIEREKIIERLVSQLERFKVPVPKGEDEGEGHNAIAQAIYKEQIEPVLEPRVEKFNELINRRIDDDQIGVAFIAFAGLAKGMARSSDTVSKFGARGDYGYKAVQTGPDTYRAIDFDKGWWTWGDEEVFISGITSFNRHLSAAIDETVEIDLKPYGKDRAIKLRFVASAQVKLEQRYGCRLVHRPKEATSPQVTVQYQPYVTVHTTKDLSGDTYLSFGDGKDYSHRETIDHPALFTVTLKAEPAEGVSVEAMARKVNQ